MMKVLFVATIGLIFVTSSALAKDKVVRLEGIKIKGDNEAPQVMYVIPWLNPKGAERLYTPIRGSEVERLKPLDPYTFERELSLHEEWKAGEQSGVDLAKE